MLNRSTNHLIYHFFIMNQLINQIYFLAVKDFNPPINDQYVEDLVVTIINDWLFPVAGLIAVAFLVYGGVQYVTAAGAEDKLKTAVRTITGAIIGLIIIFAAVAIKSSILRAIKSNYQ